MKNLQQWVSGQLEQQYPSLRQGTLQALSGDASFRRYYRQRVTDKDDKSSSFIAVDAPPEKEKNPEFVAVAQYLLGRGVLVPEVLATDFEQGFMLLSDLGDQLLLPLLQADTVDDYYAKALQLLTAMQGEDATRDIDLPDYSTAFLMQEMRLFPEWFVGRLLDYQIDDATQRLIDECFTLLVDSALAQPQVFVHRDYHSRNLMVVEGNRLATIDFQDAVWGPVTYDLVSLLRDCYVVWPEASVTGWRQDFLDQQRARGLMAGVTDAQFTRWFDWMGLQRHLKVLGIFARLAIRDGKHAYLQDLPTVMHYVLSIAERYTEFADFVGWFNQALQPLIEQQSWSSASISRKE